MSETNTSVLTDKTQSTSLPRGWSMRPLGELARIYSGGTPSRANQSYWGGDVPWATTAEVNFGTIRTTKESITSAGLKNSAAKVASPGTLLVAMYGQGKTRGKTAILDMFAAMNQACAAVEPKQDVSARFLLHFMVANYENIRAMSNSGGQENLSGQIVKKIPIILPSRVEQERIASLLDDADNLISSLERLIAKKQAIKQGMADQLLTGASRLSGFTGPWTEKRLGDLGNTYGGMSGKSAADFGSGSSKFITFMDVMSHVRVDGSNAAPVRVRTTESHNTVEVDDILFNGSSETPDELAMAAAVVSVPPNTYLNSFCFGFRPRSKEDLNSQFAAYLFRGTPGRKLLKSLAQGATRYNLSKSKFRELSVVMPELDEQYSIAAALQDADNDIDKIRMRLAKAQSIKQGMMQELLTGRTQLQPEEVSA